MDEPTSGLDVVAREQMLTLLREYMETEGRAILISSHLSGDLETFCDDICRKKENFGWSCLTDQKAYYQMHNPEIVIEKGSVDELILLMAGGERI